MQHKPKRLFSFTTYELTEEETLQGAVLTHQQIQCIQNQIADLSEELINLEPSADINLQFKFLQQQAYTKGQIAALKYLLDLSDAAERELADSINTFGED